MEKFLIQNFSLITIEEMIVEIKIFQSPFATKAEEIYEHFIQLSQMKNANEDKSTIKKKCRELERKISNFKEAYNLQTNPVMKHKIKNFRKQLKSFEENL